MKFMMRLVTKQTCLVVLAMFVIVCAMAGNAVGITDEANEGIDELKRGIDELKEGINERINEKVYRNIEVSNFITDRENQRGLQIAKDRKILFDTDPIVVDVVNIGDEKYYIIKQNSWFGFAHRLDIYKSGGGIVEDKNVARKIFGIYGWRQNIDKLSELDRSELVTISHESRKMYERSFSIHYGVGAVVSAIDEVQKLKIGGVSIWNTATRLSPELAYFEKNTRKFDEYALDGLNKSSRLNTCLPSLINDLDKYDHGEKVDWSRFAYNANETGYAVHSFCTEMRSIDTLIDDIKKIISTVNKNFDSIGCGFLGDALDSLNDKLEGEKIVKPHYEIQHEYMEIVEDADNDESDAYAKWLTSIDRDDATKFIYGLIIFVIILIILSAILLLKENRDYIDVAGNTIAFVASLVVALFMFTNMTHFIYVLVYVLIMFSILYICAIPIVGIILAIVGLLAFVVFVLANGIQYLYGLIALGIILSIVSLLLAWREVSGNNDYPEAGSMTTFIGSSTTALYLFVLICYYILHFERSINTLVFSVYAIGTVVLWMTVLGSFSQKISKISKSSSENDEVTTYDMIYFIGYVSAFGLIICLPFATLDPECRLSVACIFFVALLVIVLAVNIWHKATSFFKE